MLRVFADSNDHAVEVDPVRPEPVRGFIVTCGEGIDSLETGMVQQHNGTRSRESKETNKMIGDYRDFQQITF